MEYYLLILLSVGMFGGGFALQDVYRRKRGSSLKISMESSFIGCLAGLVVLLIINGFSFELTAFTLILAILAALNSILFTFCAFKSLDYINLSLFSLFSMLGGMVLPFFQGIIFYSEGVTIAKCLCVALICAALALTVQKGDKKRGTVFYIGIFVLNGMSGVLSKLFSEGKYPKTNAAGYSIWIAICTLVLSGVVWLILELRDRYVVKATTKDGSKPSKKILWQSYGVGALQGSVNKVANFLLVIALAHVDASVQYPMVTGGTMIVSTLICYFGDKKPSTKELISVLLAFAAMLTLFIIPI